MEKPEAIQHLRNGETGLFNEYRKLNPGWTPDLSGEDFTDIDFVEGKPIADLSGANLIGCKLQTNKSNWTYEGKIVPLTDAIIDATTEGPLSVLVELGAKYATKQELAAGQQAAAIQVFISYAWANSDVVSAIDFWLRSKGLDTRIDKRDFFAGSRIRDEIARLMQASDVVLVFHSAQSKDKPWIDFERELVADMQMNAKKAGETPPRVIYVVIDETPLPSVSEDNRIAVMAKGKRFELVCEEIYHNVLMIPKGSDDIDLSKWDKFVF